MSKSLSGLVTGEFDDVEVQNTMTVHEQLETKGRFKMSGEQPAEFRHLQVGDTTTNGDLYVYGNIIHRNGSISSLNGTALPDLIFTGNFPDGDTEKRYDGSVQRTVPIPDPPPTPNTLKFTGLVTDMFVATGPGYSNNIKTINLPQARQLHFQGQVVDTYNPYDLGGDTTITIPTYPTPSTQHQFLALYQTPTTSSNTLQTTYELVRDGAGCEFSAPTTGAVMVEVSMYVVGYPTSNITIALTKDRSTTSFGSSDLYSNTEKIVWNGDGQGIVHTRYYLSGLSGSNEVGVAIKTTYSGAKVLYGGDKPNFMVTVVSAPSSSNVQTDEPQPEPEPGGGGGGGF